MNKGASSTINPGPVFQAGLAPSIEAAQTTQPSMRGTLAGWFKPMTIGVVTEAITGGGETDGQAKASVRELKTSGMMQPGDAEQLTIQSQGQRSWDNFMLHVYRQLDVRTDTRIIIKDVPYRVMGRKDFIANGYIRYDLMEDYENA